MISGILEYGLLVVYVASLMTCLGIGVVARRRGVAEGEAAFLWFLGLVPLVNTCLALLVVLTEVAKRIKPRR